MRAHERLHVHIIKRPRNAAAQRIIHRSRRPDAVPAPATPLKFNCERLVVRVEARARARVGAVGHTDERAVADGCADGRDRARGAQETRERVVHLELHAFFQFLFNAFNIIKIFGSEVLRVVSRWPTTKYVLLICTTARNHDACAARVIPIYKHLYRAVICKCQRDGRVVI